MRRAAIGLVALVLAVSASSTVSAFDTPEAAVREYLVGVANADIEQVVGASAIDGMTEGYRFGQMVERLRGYQPMAPGPVHSPFFAGAQQADWTSALLRQARTLAYSLLAAETLGEGLELRPVLDVGSDWADGLIADLDESRLSDLVVMDVKLPEPELYETTSNLENMARMANIYGADERTDRVALIRFEGDTYLVGFALLRYSDDWGVSDQISPIVDGLSYSGAASRVSADLFSEITSE